jgi:hypothetical protein
VCAGGSSPSYYCEARPLPMNNSGGSSVWLNITTLSNRSPDPCTCASMAYDALDGYVLLVWDGRTWTFSGGAWTQLNVTGPPAICCPAMTYDAADGYVLLFGGASSGVTYNDTWTYAGGTWTQLTPAVSPPDRWLSTMAYDAQDGYVVLFGGESQSPTYRLYDDTWTFRNGTWTNLSLNASAEPGRRGAATLAYDPAIQRLVLFGGGQANDSVLSTGRSDPLNDTWTFSAGNWTQEHPSSAPPPRMLMGLAYDVAGGYLLTFGGQARNWTASGGLTYREYNDTWIYRGGNWTNRSSGVAPSPRAWANPDDEVWDSADGYLMLFGGGGVGGPNGNLNLNDTWEFGPPIMAGVTASPATIDQGQPTVIRVSALSNSVALSYAYSGLPPGCTGLNRSTIRCVPNSTGAFQVAVNVSDPSGYSLSRNTSLRVHPDPVLSAFAAQPRILDQGQLLTLAVSASNGTGVLSYSYAGLPFGCPSRNASNLSCYPSSAGNFTISAKITDQLAFSRFANVTVTVSLDPSATLGRSVGTIDLGQHTTFTVVAFRGTGNLSYQYASLPPGCVSRDVAILDCRPSATGSFTPQVTVTDATGYAVNRSTTLTVYADPVLDSFAVAPAAIDLGQSLSLWLNVSGGSNIFHYAYNGLPPGCNSTDLPSFACGPTSSGRFVIGLVATDSLNWTVNASAAVAVNPDPSVVAFNATHGTIDVGQRLALMATASGGTGGASYTYTGLPFGCSTSNLPTLSCTPQRIGQFLVQVTVHDGAGYAASATTFVTVNPDPTVSSLVAEPSALVLGENTTFVATASGGTGFRSFAYSGLPGGCSSRNASIVVCHPTTAGTFAVTVTVTDSVGWNSSANAALQVTAPVIAPSNGGSGFPAWGYGLLVVLGVVGVALGLFAWRARGARGRDTGRIEGGAELPPDPSAEDSEFPPNEFDDGSASVIPAGVSPSVTGFEPS